MTRNANFIVQEVLSWKWHSFSVKNVQMSKLVQRKVTSCNSCSTQQKYKITFQISHNCIYSVGTLLSGTPISSGWWPKPCMSDSAQWHTSSIHTCLVLSAALFTQVKRCESALCSIHFLLCGPLLKLGWLPVALYILQVDPPLLKDLVHAAHAIKMICGTKCWYFIAW